MSIKHHLDYATIMSFAAGTLSPGVAMVASCHIDNCPRCRDAVMKAQSLGGAMLDTAPTAAMADDALDQALSKLDQLDSLDEVGTEAAQAAGASKPAANVDPEIPAPLRPYLSASLDDLKWKTLVPGVKVYELPVSGSDSARLLKIAPGVPIMHHGHKGTELTMVLRGSFTDEIGRFQPGDIADLDEQTHHQPVTDSSQPCICLVATDAPLKFSSFVGRLVQPLLGF